MDKLVRPVNFKGLVICFYFTLFSKDSGRAKYISASDEEALNAYKLVSKLEKISPSLEPSHAFAYAIKIAPKLKSSDIIIVNSCGDSIKDKDIIKNKLGSYIR